MKIIKIFLFCMIAAILVQAQNLPPHTLSEVEIVPPKFTAHEAVSAKTGVSANAYIAKKFIYPDVTDVPHEGTEVVQFAISTSGEIGNITIINSVSEAVDKEIIRVLKTTNKMWEPGQNNGIPVLMEKELAILITVGASEMTAPSGDFTSIATAYFQKGAKKLFVKQKTRQALHQFENAVRYRPYDKSSLLLLALCKLELGQNEAADKDIARIKKLGGVSLEHTENLTENTQNLKSYTLLMEELASR